VLDYVTYVMCVMHHMMCAAHHMHAMRGLTLSHATPPLANRFLLSSLLAEALIRMYLVRSNLLGLDVIC
jgi:hypothetical protein